MDLNKVKNEKGITLIALAVTIVVLLILAGVSLNAVFSQNGIISKAQDAQNKMNDAKESDWNSLNNLNDEIEKYTNNGWTQNKTSVTNGKITYEVGEDYEYDCGVEDYEGDWKILGAENGKLLIMSTENIGELKLTRENGDELNNVEYGYNNGIEKMNEMCAKYGVNARSVTIEDINRITGYDPKKQGDGTWYGANEWTEYGATVTYTTTKVVSSNGLEVEPNSWNEFVDNNGKKLGEDIDYVEMVSNIYEYYPYSLTYTTSDITGECKGIEVDSKAYEMIFGEYEKTLERQGNAYWLASQCLLSMGNNGVYYCMRAIEPSGLVYRWGLYASYGGMGCDDLGVRAVVVL